MTAFDMDMRELSFDEVDEVSGAGRGAALRALARFLARRAEMAAEQLEALINRGDDEEE